ncbi:MAG: Bud site selection protein 6 [Peltula sp. TS41687]|nr:MAG: Bud site selection protein 6 [Peltula sp. TS41687]
MQATSTSQRPVHRRPANVPTSSSPQSTQPPSINSFNYSQPQPSSRTPSNSSRSQQYKRSNQSQQLSQIEKSVTHLLVATKQLLETLTQWSRHNATEAEVSDVYVRLGYEFNIATRAFQAIGVDTSDLGNVPDLLRSILEDTLSQEASSASLDRYLPRIRDIIINLLHGLKRKQQKLRQRQNREEQTSAVGSSTRQDSVASVGSGESGLVQTFDDGSGRYSSNGMVANQITRSGSKDNCASEETGMPPRSTSVQADRVSPARHDGMTSMSGRPRTSSTNQDGSGSSGHRTLVGPSPSVSGSTLQPASAAAYPSEEYQQMNGFQPSQAAPTTTAYPPPPPPPKQDALATLQRSGDLERRASRRYSAYQISKHLGASTSGMPILPPHQNSPIPNRGRDVRESMNAVRVRGSVLHSQSRAAHPPAVEGSSSAHSTVPRRISEESTQSTSIPIILKHENATGSSREEIKTRASEERHGQTPSKLGPDQNSMKRTGSGASQRLLNENLASDSRPFDQTSEKSVAREVTTKQLDQDDGRLAASAVLEGRQRSLERSPEPGKELTLFLQYKSKIKKFVLPEGESELSIPRLQLAFIEKFSWNTQSNGNDLPDIYIQDPISGVRHELEDLSDIRDRSVLVLNVEPLDEVKRHIDERVADLGKLVTEVRHVVDGQQAAIQRVSDRQTDAAKDLARLAAGPGPTSQRVSLVDGPLPNGVCALPKSDDKTSQLHDIQNLRRDLAVMRQTYSSFVSDVQASMSEIRTKASSVKSAANDAVVPKMDHDTGRAYVNKGQKELGELSDSLVSKVDDLQDIVEDLRKDVVSRGVRPLPRQLETVGKGIMVATAELKRFQEFLRREKPKWTKIWEKELQVVCDDRDLLSMIESLATDLKDDLEHAAQTFALVEEATKEQMKDAQGSGSRSTSRSLTAVSVDPSADPHMAKEGVLGEVRALQPNHENRLEAIERAEKARQRELESRRGGELQKELGSFIEEGKLKKSGGFEEAERQRKVKDDRIRKEVWERESSIGKGKETESPKSSNSDERAPQIPAEQASAEKLGTPTSDETESSDRKEEAKDERDGPLVTMQEAAADSPLICATSRDDDEDDIELQTLSEHATEQDLKRPSLLLWVLVFSAGISGLLFGYDTGVISATLISIGSDLSRRPLSTLDKSLITSSTSLFALVASPISGVLADRFGRKRVILLADGLFIVGALWQACTGTVWGMIAGRSVIGMAVGAASLVVPLYICELSPSPFRGRLVTLSCLLITVGQVISYVVGYMLSQRAHGWRWMVGLAAFPACVQCLTLVFLPESPRWLVKCKRTPEALRTLQSVFGSAPETRRMARRVLRGIEREVVQEEKEVQKRHAHHHDDAVQPPSWRSRVLGDSETWREVVGVGGNRRALTIACMLQGLQQLCGFDGVKNSLMYFSATIFALVGFTSPTLTSLSIAVTNCLFTFISFAFIDRIGRRRILLRSIPVMVVGLLLSSIAFEHVTISDLNETVFHRGQPPAADVNMPIETSNNRWPVVIFVALIIYVAGYAIGLGNVPWQQSELFPLSIRSIGSSVATATNWGSNFIVGLTFLPMMELLTPTGTFALYATACLAGWVVLWRIYPETTGLSLEEVGGLLKDGWGVKTSGERVS